MGWIGSACIAAALLAPRVAGAAGIHAAIVPSNATPMPGDTILVEIKITTADASFNAFDAPIRFDPARFQFVSMTSVSQQIGPVMTSVCNNFFHIFTPAPDSLDIHLSMLCPNTTATGPGAVYRARLLVLAPTGPTMLTWGPSSKFVNGGLYVNPLDITSATLQVGGETGIESSVAPEAALALEPLRPNPGHASGSMTLAFRTPATGAVRFELFDTQGRRIATRDAGVVPAGRGSITWDGLRLNPGLYLLRMTAGAGSPPPRAWIVLR